MEDGYTDIEGLAMKMEEQNAVQCRLSLLKGDGENWTLQNMFVDSRALSEEVAWQAYDYGRVTFTNDVLSGKAVATWLRDGLGESRAYRFQIPALQPRVRWIRYGSHMRNNPIYGAPEPHTTYQADYTTSLERLDLGFLTPLVRESCPSFPNYATAAYRFLYEQPFKSGYDVPREGIVIRVANLDAWIQHVFLEPHEIEVEIKGTKVEGTRLVIGTADGIKIDERMASEGVFRFEIANGSSDEIWLVLSDGDRWLDSRNIARNRSQSIWENVDIQRGDLAALVQEMIPGGENDRLEFKERVPDENEKFLKSVAAFGNGKGGTILIGVCNDSSVAGIRAEVKRYGSLAKYKDAITDSICNRLVPQAPSFRITECVIEGREVIVITIDEGDQKPYGLNSNPPTFFVRRSSTTRQASTGEIRTLARESLVTSDYRSGWEL